MYFAYTTLLFQIVLVSPPIPLLSSFFFLDMSSVALRSAPQPHQLNSQVVSLPPIWTLNSTLNSVLHTALYFAH